MYNRNNNGKDNNGKDNNGKDNNGNNNGNNNRNNNRNINRLPAGPAGWVGHHYFNGVDALPVDKNSQEYHQAYRAMLEQQIIDSIEAQRQQFGNVANHFATAEYREELQQEIRRSLQYEQQLGRNYAVYNAPAQPYGNNAGFSNVPNNYQQQQQLGRNYAVYNAPAQPYGNNAGFVTGVNISPAQPYGNNADFSIVPNNYRIIQEMRDEFIPSSSYIGSKEGYVFKTGVHGRGYYKDVEEVIQSTSTRNFKQQQQLGRDNAGFVTGVNISPAQPNGNNAGDQRPSLVRTASEFRFGNEPPVLPPRTPNLQQPDVNNAGFGNVPNYYAPAQPYGNNARDETPSRVTIPFGNGLPVVRRDTPNLQQPDVNNAIAEAADLSREFKNIAYKEVFNAIDINENGNISRDEFDEFLRNYDLGLTDDQLQDFFYAFDTDRNGTIDIHEFIDAMHMNILDRNLRDRILMFGYDMIFANSITPRQSPRQSPVVEAPAQQSGQSPAQQPEEDKYVCLYCWLDLEGNDAKQFCRSCGTCWHVACVAGKIVESCPQCRREGEAFTVGLTNKPVTDILKSKLEVLNNGTQEEIDALNLGGSRKYILKSKKSKKSKKNKHTRKY